jgi:hypothetical protein
MIVFNMRAIFVKPGTTRTAWAFPQGRPSCVDSLNKDKTGFPTAKSANQTVGGSGANATSAVKPAAVQGMGMKWNGSLCQLVVVIQQGVADLRFLVGFILSGFLVSSIKLWLTKRNAYRGIKGTTTQVLTLSLLTSLFSCLLTSLQFVGT